MLSVETSKITGNPGDSGWAQVHEFRPEEEDKLAKRGELFAVIATSKGGSGVDEVARGRELLARLHEEYFGEVEKPAFYALKDAIEKVISEFKPVWGEVEIAAASFVGSVVYSAAGGGGQAVVFREGMLAKILDSKASSGEGISASGYPKKGDTFLLASNTFFEILPQGVIKAALEGGGPAEAAEALAPYVHSRQDSGAVGAIILKFSEKGAFMENLGREKPSEEKEEISAPIEEPALQTQKLGEKVLPVFEKVVGTFSKLIGRTLPERRIYVKAPREDESLGQNRKLALSVGVILLVLLLISIGFGIRQRGIKDSKLKYETRLTQAKHDLGEAEKLYSIDPSRARELFFSARSLITEIENEGVKDPEVTSVKDEIGQKEGLILGIYRVDPETFIDLSILSSGLTGSDLSASEDKVFVLDKNGKKVVSVSFDTKKTEVVAGPDQISEADTLASYESRVFILSGGGVSEVGEKGKKVIEKDWEGGAFFSAYAGNIYLIDKEGKTIWRYAGTADGFSSKSKWNAGEIDLNFNDISGVTVDGSIWILTNSGSVARFSLGNRVAFALKGVLPEVSSGAAIYTSEDLKYVYILDRGASRVVVADKSGEYKAQYVSDKVSEATDLGVSEATKKIILLSGSKLYSFPISHLD